MKVEFDIPIAIGDTIYKIAYSERRCCCECPESEKIKNGVCISKKNGLCNSWKIIEIKVNSYFPYLTFTENNTIKLAYGYYKTKKEAINVAKKRNFIPVFII